MTDNLFALLLNQDARQAYRRSRMGPPLFGLSGVLPNVNATYGGRSMNNHGHGCGASHRGG